LRLSSCRGTHPELTAVNLLVPPLDGPTQVDAGMPSAEYGAIGTSRPTLTDCAAGAGLGRRHRKVPYPMLPPIAWHGSADLNDAGGGAGDRWRHRRCGRWTSLRGAHIRGSSARSMIATGLLPATDPCNRSGDPAPPRACRRIPAGHRPSADQAGWDSTTLRAARLAQYGKR
jgi:hypothetical protein